MVDQRPATNGSPEHTNTTLFEQYDEKINVADFSIIHDGFHDHLFLLQDFHLQKNNPGKESLFVDGKGLYTDSYTYLYNPDNTPSVKTGAFVYTSGPDSGKVFKPSRYILIIDFVRLLFGELSSDITSVPKMIIFG